MENILGVTSFLRKKIIENGGDPERETLNVIPTKDGNSYFVDSEGEYWRCYNFIEGATSYDQVESEEDFIKAQSLLVISKDYWPIIRQKPFMKRSKDSMIQKPALKHLKKL